LENGRNRVMNDKLKEYRRRWKGARNDWEKKGIELEVRVWKRRQETNKIRRREGRTKCV